LTKLEKLIDEAQAQGILVDDTILSEESSVGGLYLGWPKLNLHVILINRHRSQRHQTAVMAEEIGHYHTCVGNALDQNDVVAVKKENAGRGAAYQRVIPAQKLKKAMTSGNRTVWDLSEALDLPATFILEALQYYTVKGCLGGEEEGCVCCVMK